jgi:hypothetical protein
MGEIMAPTKRIGNVEILHGNRKGTMMKNVPLETDNGLLYAYNKEIQGKVFFITSLNNVIIWFDENEP